MIVLEGESLPPLPSHDCTLFFTNRLCNNRESSLTSGVPRHLDSDRIKEDLLKLEDVQSVEELNIWALTSDKTAALVHIQLGMYNSTSH